MMDSKVALVHCPGRNRSGALICCAARFYGLRLPCPPESGCAFETNHHASRAATYWRSRTHPLILMGG